MENEKKNILSNKKNEVMYRIDNDSVTENEFLKEKDNGCD